MSDVVLVELDACRSTQDEVRSRLTTAAPGSVIAVSAGSQRVGRGREGRSWQDPPGEALLLSVGVQGPLPASVLEELPRRVAGVLLDTLGGGEAIRWKAPNDLVDTSGAKLAGILVDARTVGTHVEHVVIGIGVNLSGPTFTTSDGREATTLEAVLGTAPARVDAAPQILHAVQGLISTSAVRGDRP